MKYQHIRSFVTGKVPTSDQLKEGELSINFADGKLFSKNDKGEVVVVANLSANTTSEVDLTNYITKDEVTNRIASNINTVKSSVASLENSVVNNSTDISDILQKVNAINVSSLVTKSEHTIASNEIKYSIVNLENIVLQTSNEFSTNLNSVKDKVDAIDTSILVTKAELDAKTKSVEVTDVLRVDVLPDATKHKGDMAFLTTNDEWHISDGLTWFQVTKPNDAYSKAETYNRAEVDGRFAHLPATYTRIEVDALVANLQQQITNILKDAGIF